MKKVVPFFIVMALAGYCYSQDVTPVPRMTPPALPPLLPTPVPPPSSWVENDVVKISTTLIQLDVTVTDKSGRAVTDIRPDEIEIYENGQKQDISHFSFISIARKPAAETERKKEDKTAVPTPPRTLKPEQVRRTIALVVDDLTLSFESAHRVRAALKKFVDEQMQDG